MSHIQQIQVVCPKCNYSNAVTAPIAKYKEVLYQPFADNEGQPDHNIKDQNRCDSCHNDFDFYWVRDTKNSK